MSPGSFPCLAKKEKYMRHISYQECQATKSPELSSEVVNSCSWLPSDIREGPLALRRRFSSVLPNV